VIIPGYIKGYFWFAKKNKKKKKKNNTF